MRILITGLTLMILSFPLISKAQDSSPRILVWDKLAMNVTLPVGVEKLIEFPQTIVDLQVPAFVNEPVSRITLLPSGRLYWTAQEDFDDVRVRAQGADGEIYLFNINASTKLGEPNPLVIEAHDPEAETRIRREIEQSLPKRGHDYIDLARYAAQHMYGPQRLIKALPGVIRRPIPTESVALFRGGAVVAIPVVQWMSLRPEQYVSVVEVRNLTNQTIEIDPRSIRGKWLFSASHNATLEPKGFIGDTTHIYLVSALPFERIVDGIQINYSSQNTYLPTGTK